MMSGICLHLELNLMMNKNEIPPRFKSNSKRFIDALALAAESHAFQTRKATDIPYIAHLLGAASIAIEYGGGEDEAIAALLHDAPEDCGGLPVLEVIRARFGERVAQIVEGCTDTFDNPKPEWQKRKADYIAHARRADASTRLVSAADKLHNARSILMDYCTHGAAVFDRFKKDTKWHTVWYYRRLADVFNAAEDNALNRELQRVVSEIERMLETDAAGNACEKEQVYRELDKALAAASTGELKHDI